MDDVFIPSNVLLASSPTNTMKRVVEMSDRLAVLLIMHTNMLLLSLISYLCEFQS
jgi:hypothetical protein